MKRGLSQREVEEYMIRALWAVCEQHGGTLVIPAEQAGAMTGAISVNVEDSGEITVSIAKGHGAQHQ